MNPFTRYSPGETFPSISITGRRCALNCAHCGGRYLEHMMAAETPIRLAETMRSLRKEGASGVLISGGFDHGGSLPIADFTDVLGQTKRETGLLVNVHPGMQMSDGFKELKNAGVDCASLDLLDENPQSRAYPLEYGLEDYSENAKRARDAGLWVVPHITVGLCRSFEDSVECILSGGYTRVIVNTLIGLKSVPGLKEETVRLVRMLHGADASLEIISGCMRPRNDAEFEKAIYEAGACGMVNPSRGLLYHLRKTKKEVNEEPTCCALRPVQA